MKITKREKARVPWQELAKAPTKYLDAGTFPKHFEFLDPSKLQKDAVSSLWYHWSARARSNLPVLVFIKAREQDLGIRARYIDGVSRVSQKRMPYVELDSSDEAGGDLDESERPPPSKRPRLSKQAAVPDALSPAAHSSRRKNYLRLLSFETPYKALLDGVLALPAVVSPFFLHP